MRQLIMGFRTTQLIYVAAKLDVADQLTMGPRTAEEIAPSVGANPKSLYRLLRALAAIGLLSETVDHRFALEPMGELLRTDMPGSMSSVALLYGEDWLWHAYGNLLFSALTGQSAFREKHGLSFYDFLEENPTAAAVFQGAMASFSQQEARAILRAYDFGNAKTVVDVGGSRGTLLAAILHTYPHLSGVVFDLPAAKRGAEELLSQADLAPRITFAGGDFFTAIPDCGDLYIFKSVLHNWDDAAASRILRVCRRSMPDNGRLLIIERVIQPDNNSSEAVLFDINMLVTVGGLERTEDEFKALLAEAGFVISRVIATASPLTLLEAVSNP